MFNLVDNFNVTCVSMNCENFTPSLYTVTTEAETTSVK